MILRARKRQAFTWKTSKACFICQSLFLPTKARSSPESPLLSQKQAKLVLSTKARDYKPHKKRPCTKGLFPHPSRIAASIAKISKAYFYPQSLFYLLKACFYPPKPGPHQNRRFNRKNKQSLFLSISNKTTSRTKNSKRSLYSQP